MKQEATSPGFYYFRFIHVKAYIFHYSLNKLMVSITLINTTYNVLLRYLAYVSRCCSLLPIMLKIFDVICQLADDFYEKSIFFHILEAGFCPSKSVRAFSLLLLTIRKWQFSVSGQYFFNRADKNKSTRKCTLPDLFRPCFIIRVTLTYLITAMNKN